MDSFAFLVHPRHLEDIYRKFRFARWLPAGLTHKLLAAMPPWKLAEIRGVDSSRAKIRGFFIAVPLTSQQMLQLPVDFVIERVLQAGRLAEKMGAKLLGLGAYTSVVGDGGITLARSLKIPVTSGNSLTAAAAIAAVPMAARLMGMDLSQSEVTVIGTGAKECPGLVIAEAASLLLAGKARRVRLAGREKECLIRIPRRGIIDNSLRVEYTFELREALRRADVVLVAAGSSELVIFPEDLKPGAILCDIARPREVSERIASLRNDVLVFDGGLLEVPGEVDFGFSFGLPAPLTYPCIAETMVLTLEGRYENYSLGNMLEADKIVEIYQIAQRYGFRLAALRFNEQVLEPERCLMVKARASLKKSAATGRK
ncbi:MAG: shikimate dehydrogenase [Syntrophomonadaceae bacterium]|nr:shikimate dehydrogenase [Syntrophomonadaceae bacterium]